MKVTVVGDGELARSPARTDFGETSHWCFTEFCKLTMSAAISRFNLAGAVVRPPRLLSGDSH
jgi:hypothetical protein